MDFEWDEAKNAWNINKRGLSFIEAARIFAEAVYEAEDTRRAYGEKRIKAIGRAGDNVLCVVYTMREGRRRIISARKASRNERRIYNQSQTAP